jgi:hypothetical protein
MGSDHSDKTIFDKVSHVTIPVAPWFKKPWVWLAGAFVVLCVAAYFLA